MDVEGQLDTGCCRRNESAATAPRDVMVCLLGLGTGFKAFDALIWTLCQQDVTFVGFLRQV
jgi:hypothetical protein